MEAAAAPLVTITAWEALRGRARVARDQQVLVQAGAGGVGHMSVQIMLPEHGAGNPSNPVKYEQNGYEAYYGTYEVDERAHTVTHHVEGALVRALVGKNLTRQYRFEGKQLILKSSRADEHWSIAWERY